MSPGAVWSRRLGFLSLVVLVVSGLCHRYGLVATTDLPNLAVAVMVLAAVGLFCALVALRRYWTFGDRGGSDIFWGFFWCLATVAPLAAFAYWYAAYPPLNDISTDPENPPSLTEAARLRTAGMNPIIAPTPKSIIEQAENYPLIKGRRYDLPLDSVLAAVDGIIARRGWSVMATRDAVGMTFETTVEAAAHSPVLAMPADVAIRLTDEGTATFVDMRSASRYWRHDLGDNAARIASFLTELDGETAAQTGVAPAAADAAPGEDEGDGATNPGEEELLPDAGAPEPQPRPQ